MIIFIKNSRLNNNGNGGSDVNDADVVYRLDGQTVNKGLCAIFFLGPNFFKKIWSRLL